MSDDNLLALLVFLLVFACIMAAVMVARGDSDSRRLQGRIRSLHDVAVGPSSTAAKPMRNIRRTTGGSPLTRALERIGRSRHIPKERRVAWPIVVVAGAAAAFGGSDLGKKVFSATVAPVHGVAVGFFAACCSAGKAPATSRRSSSSSRTPWA